MRVEDDRSGMRRLKSIDRAFDIVHLLWRLDGATPTTVADHLDVSVSTAHDYLQSLAATGYVTNDEGEYALGYAFLAMGSRLQRRNRLFHVARPELRELADDTGELANVGIAEGDDWVLLHNEVGSRGLELGDYPGLRTAFHTHAAGKVVLAHFPEERRDELLAGDLEAVTAETTTDPDALREELATIREEGVAIDRDGQVVGIGVVAAPLLADEEILGSLAVVCPSGRLADEADRERLRRTVREAADTVMINYRYSG